MAIAEKIFCFTRKLEENLKNLLKIEKLAEDKRAQTEVNLKLVSRFNKMEFLSHRHEFKR